MRTGDSTDPSETTRWLRELWAERGQRLGTTIDIPDCPFTASELSSLAEAGRRLAYLPPELATQRGRVGLGALFPQMGCYSLLVDNVVTNDDDACGWFDYDADTDSPMLGTDESSLLDALRCDGRALLSLNQYVVASQDVKDLTGSYLDERRTWTRVGSRVDGRIVAARFDGAEMAEGLGNEEPVDGSLLVAYDVGANDCGPVLGGRSTSLSSRRITTPEPADERFAEPVEAPVDIETEWRRLADGYVAVGFHAQLGMTADEYRDALPRATSQPEAYRGRFDVPLLVETRIPWQRQAELGGIALSSQSRASGYGPIDDRSAPPDRPYWAWFNGWGQRFPDPIAPADARAALADDEVGGSVVELVAMQIAHPQLNVRARLLEGIGFVRPHVAEQGLANATEPLRVPCLYRWRGRPEIGANLHPTAFTLFRPLVRGAAVTV